MKPAVRERPLDHPRQNRGIAAGAPPPSAGIRARHLARRTWRALRNDRVAASHLVYFLLSAALFMPLVGGMLYFMRDVSESQVDLSTGLEARSRDVLEKITGSAGWLDPGLVWDGDQRDWETYGPGLQVSEVGITEPTSHRLLSAEKIRNLQQAGIVADPTDAFLDYEEMHAALRLDDRFGFHLRIEPIRTDLRVDPYGTQPLKGTHVAYVGVVNSAGFDHATQQWSTLSAQAQKEIAALKALGLGAPSGGVQGFDGLGYYPQVCGASPTSLKHGVVLADRDISIQGPAEGTSCLLTQTKVYPRWFAEDYLFLPDGERRFDVVVFGSGVGLAKWKSAGEQQFRDFVADGGTLIFLTQTGAAGFVNKCAADPCLLYETGNPPAMTVADETHQLLFAPNAISGAIATGTAWSICTDADASTTVNELHGFYPVMGMWTDPCFSVHLGTTTHERYGEGGGTVILAGLNLAGADPDDVSALFANMIGYGVLSTAYLVYGEHLPDDRPIRVAQRVMALELPHGSHISVSAKLYLWRNW